MRISRPQMFMEIAHTVAKRSTCMRLNVGAIVVHDRRIVSIGYNGVPSGEPHCEALRCLASEPCNRTTHAEKNALDYAPSDIYNADLYVTASPCAECYDQIHDDGRIDRVFFQTPYRITDHLHNSLFGIKVYRVLPAGYIMDWDTGELVDVET